MTEKTHPPVDQEKEKKDLNMEELQERLRELEKLQQTVRVLTEKVKRLEKEKDDVKRSNIRLAKDMIEIIEVLRQVSDEGDTEFSYNAIGRLDSAQRDVAAEIKRLRHPKSALYS